MHAFKLRQVDFYEFEANLVHVALYIFQASQGYIVGPCFRGGGKKRGESGGRKGKGRRRGRGRNLGLGL